MLQILRFIKSQAKQVIYDNTAMWTVPLLFPLQIKQ